MHSWRRERRTADKSPIPQILQKPIALKDRSDCKFLKFCEPLLKTAVQSTKQSAICSFLVFGPRSIGLGGVLFEVLIIYIYIYFAVEPVYYSQNRGDYVLTKTQHIVQKNAKNFTYILLPLYFQTKWSKTQFHNQWRLGTHGLPKWGHNWMRWIRNWWLVPWYTLDWIVQG